MKLNRIHGVEIGKNSSHIYAHVACVRCGLVRWVQEANMNYMKKVSKYTGLCRSCTSSKVALATRRYGADNNLWKGGRSLDGYGYIRIRLSEDDPLLSMVGKSGYVREHRYVMACAIGRPLERWEVVHHKNGVKTDNRLENLELLPGITQHLPHMVEQSQWHSLENRVATLEQRVILLEAENTVLRSLTAVQ